MQEDKRPQPALQEQYRHRTTSNHHVATQDIDSDTGFLRSPDSPRTRDSFDKHGKKKSQRLDHDYDDSYSDAASSAGDEEEESKRLINNATIILTDPQALAIEEEEHLPTVAALHGQSNPTTTSTLPPPPDAPVTWMSLPRKDQLFVLVIARLSEPLAQTSLASYMFYQLRSFDPTLPDSSISQQAGLLAAGFTGAQFLTAMMWGRLADSPRVGRKRVLLVGLVGTAVGALGFGFSGGFYTALFWRVVGGALNGNVGVMRTMISEIIREKKFQSRAFLLLPMMFNVGVIVGPIMGGLLADPVKGLPWLFGEGGVLGGDGGVEWMRRWPYALPNLVSAAYLAFAAVAVVLGLEETLESLRGQRDWGLRVGSWLKGLICWRRQDRVGYQAVALDDHDPPTADMELQSPDDTPARAHRTTLKGKKRTLPFRAIFTPNVLAVLVAHGVLAAHVGLFSNMWFVFLSTPRYVPPPPSGTFPPGDKDPNASLKLPPDYHPSGPFRFTGGLALPPPRIGTSLAVLGVIGLALQFTLFPYLTHRLGTVSSYRLSLLLFPLAYLAAPYLALVPTPGSPAPLPADGPAFWLALVAILTLQVLARTFALPATAILVNNASPHPSVLGTVHGVGQSVSSMMRTIGPVLGGWGYGAGLSAGVVGAVWWGMAVWAVGGVVAGMRVRDGDGHEIWLEGDEELESTQRGRR